MTTLGDLARNGVVEFSDGYRTKRTEHAESGFRILRAGDVRDGRIHPDGPDFVAAEYASVIGGKAARSGDVVLTTKGTVGRTGIVKHLSEPVVYSPQVCYFRNRRSDLIDLGFLHQWLSSPGFIDQAGYLKNATDMAPYISLRDLASVRIDFPALVTQRAIAEVLGALDDKIAANQSLSAVAAELMLAQVQTWAAGSGVVPLSALATSKTVQVTPSQMGAVAHFSLPAFDTAEFPAEDSGESIKSNKFLINAPSVLLSRLNPRIQRVWDLPELPWAKAVASTEFVVLEPMDMPTGALWAALSQVSVNQRLQELARGTSGSHQRVRPNEAVAVEVPDVRLLSGQQKTWLGDLSRRRWLARTESRHLATLRDALLPHLMSGRLTVREAEETVEAAL